MDREAAEADRRALKPRTEHPAPRSPQANRSKEPPVSATAPSLCPRCTHEHLAIQTPSAVAGAWDVYQCGRCLYTWRTTEPARRTQPAAYPAAFKLTAEDIDNAIEVPSVPPLRG